MRKPITLLTIALSICAILPTQAQWGTDVVNRAINWELQVVESEYTGNNDLNGEADPTIKTQCFVDGAPQAEACKTWDCSAPCTDASPGGWWAGINTSYTASLAFYGVAFESDGADDCVYQDGDDDYWAGYLTLRDGLTDMPIMYPSSDFAPCQWNPWLASGTTWLMPNTAEFDQRMRLTWRYAAGDGPNNMLDLGTVSMNTTKADVNSNRSVSGQNSSAALQYVDVGGSFSAEVFYKFHLDQASTVIISTDHELTNFDTKLGLYSLPGGEYITGIDGGGTLPGTDVINIQLCAGDYQVIVNGYQDNSGLFRVSVTAQAPIAPSITVTSNPGTSCAAANDGVVSWTSTGGVGAVGYVVNGTNVGNTTTRSDFWVGTHTIQVVDACGTTGSVTFPVANGDATAPTALCQATLSIGVTEGQNTLVTPAEVDNGSSDNCEAIELSVLPSSFSTSDVGLQGVVLTVTDENNNASTCTCVVSVENVTGMEEAAMAARIRVLPNPSEGHFQLDLSELSLSADTRMDITDALGRTVFTINPTRSLLDVDLGHLPDGAYMVRLSDPQWDAMKRIVIQR